MPRILVLGALATLLMPKDYWPKVKSVDSLKIESG